MSSATPSSATLRLVFPQWQGSGHVQAKQLYQGAFNLKNVLQLPATFEAIEVSSQASGPYAGVNAHAELVNHAKQMRKVLEHHLPKRIITVGGDCGVDLLPASYLNAHYNGLALLWLDAHADLNTPESSPSGAFHGMVLRTLLGEGEPALLEQMYAPFEREQLFLLGVRDFDAPERAYVDEKNLALFTVQRLSEQSDQLVEALEQRGFSKLHLHFDLDVLDLGEGVTTCYGVPGGLKVAAVNRLFERLNSDFDIVGLSVSEYAPEGEDDVGRLVAGLEPLLNL